MKELNVKPCANGVKCYVSFDETDGTIIIFNEVGSALGYVNVSDLIKLTEKQKPKKLVCRNLCEFCPSCGAELGDLACGMNFNFDYCVYC